MFFAIKLKDFDVWLGKKNLSYFITDDAYFTFRPEKESMECVLRMGVSEKQRRVFSSTDEMRRSLNRCNKETVVKPIVFPNGFNCQTLLNCEVLTKGNSFGKFSNFVVVDLTNDKTYPLDDVISGLV
jgi:hypothetical protein